MPSHHVPLGPALLAWTDAGHDPAARRSASRALLAELIGLLAPRHDPTIAQRCSRCGGFDHGRPLAVAAPVAVSVSYAGALAVAAAVPTSHTSAIGVDVEAVGGAEPDLRHLFAPRPAPDLAGWTRIEAALKADGRGLRVPPGDVRVKRAFGARGAFLARVPGRSAALRLVTLDTTLPGHVVSVAMATAKG